MKKVKFLTADQITPPVKVSDKELEYLATQYRQSAKLQLRMTFAEFMVAPLAYLEACKNWPACVWSIDFEDYGSHKKMWTTDVLTNKTVDLSVIRNSNVQAASLALFALMDNIGKPDLVKLELKNLNVNLMLKATLNAANVRWEVINDGLPNVVENHKEVA